MLETVGSYQITGTIGQGGMGQVYLARHTLLGRPAAVKMLLPVFSQDPEQVARFFNEARAATAVRHAGIVEIYDFGFHTDGCAYIAMEFLEGESLASRLARGRAPVTSALAVARQIANVLASAHAKGIVHRDLKPDNVFLVPDSELPSGERVKVLDFGIAKLTADVGQAHMTRTGSIMGTPSYMAPEQCRGVPVDQRADLYSLGCILFEMITGRTPFVGEGVGDVLAAHIHLPAPDVATFAPDVAPAIRVLIQRLLEKDPAARVQRAEEIVAAIDAVPELGLLVRSGISLPSPAARPTSNVTTLGGAASAVARSESPPARKTWIAATVGAAAVTIVAVVVLMTNGSSEKSDSTSPASISAPSPVPAPTPQPEAVTPAPTVAPTAPELPTPAQAPSIDEATSVSVSIDSKPAGAQVTIDSARVGTTPYRGTLPRGTTTTSVELHMSGYRDATLSLVPDRAIAETVTLTKRRASTGTADTSGAANPFP